MSENPILETVAKVVALQEGIAEFSAPHTLEVLLPESVAHTLDVEEEVTFTTTAEVREGCFVSYNSEILKRFETLLEPLGYVGRFGVKYDGYLKKTGFEKLILNRLTPQNGLIRFIEAHAETTPYLLCNVAYTATADEKRLGMVSFCVNEITGVAPVEIGDALLWTSDRVEGFADTNGAAVEFEKLSRIIEKTSAKLIVADIEKWQASLNRKQQRDENRVKEYYRAIAQEINAKIKKKNLEGEQRDRERARIAATQKEQERKIKDIQERYALKLEAQLHSALIIELPTVHIHCELIRKKQKREVVAVWNPFSKELEPLRCDRSDTGVYSFYLSDDEAQILSPACWEELFSEKKK